MLEQRDKTLADALSRAVISERDSRELASLRVKVADPDLRYFLALLLNVRSRPTIVRLVGLRFGEANVFERIDGWLQKLVAVITEREREGEKRGGAEADTPFAITALSPSELWTVGQMIRGESDEAIAARASRGEAPRAEAVKASQVARLRFILSFTSLLRPLLTE